MRGDSFKKFCEDINRQDILDLWDYELNDKDPDQVTKQSNCRIYFKCPRGLHESSKVILATLSNQLAKGKEYKLCKACNSIGQYIIDNYGQEYLDNIWSDKNEKSYFDISSGSATKFWLRCLNDDSHPDYDINGYNFKASSGCPYCTGKRVCETNSLGYKYPEVLEIWSDKNTSTPFDYTYGSTSHVWFKCKEGLHDDYHRAINDGGKLNFVCPECGILNKHVLRGEEHPSWKGGVKTEVENIRSSRVYAKWRTQCMERDDYTCQCCGSHGGNLNVHHIKDFANHPELRLDESNGITLCENCHKNSCKGSLHNVYGSIGVTPEELEEYINNKRNELGIPIPFNIDDYKDGNRLNKDSIKEIEEFFKVWNFVPYLARGIRPVKQDNGFAKIKPKFRIKED